jgi:hypothetical protein
VNHPTGHAFAAHDTTVAEFAAGARASPSGRDGGSGQGAVPARAERGPVSPVTKWLEGGSVTRVAFEEVQLVRVGRVVARRRWS